MTRIDFEKETPGPTGYYRNLVTYDDIIEGWTNEKLLSEFATVNELMALNDPPMPTNTVRVELIIQAKARMRKEILRRLKVQ